MRTESSRLRNATLFGTFATVSWNAAQKVAGRLLMAGILPFGRRRRKSGSILAALVVVRDGHPLLHDVGRVGLVRNRPADVVRALDRGLFRVGRWPGCDVLGVLGVGHAATLADADRRVRTRRRWRAAGRR